ncbi:MAG: 3-dehydroquinate dehydratase [Desulfovibrionaceae bacterium]|nr:3-dehydroquinate dehydratase [Desulfovibrionaceae bacterium]MBF0513261.1 3-dehydroquinate dehydratase [Desulfovibrionaceae bacterium]
MNAKCRIVVVNGPNLGHLGVRQPEIYGSQTLDDLPLLLRQMLGQASEEVELDFFQSNSEGALIDRLERAWRESADGIVINAGAYTHTSLALADALAWIGIACVEVHLSNIWARTEDPVRQKSHLGKNCLGVIAGFGLSSYALAVAALWRRWKTP